MKFLLSLITLAGAVSAAPATDLGSYNTNLFCGQWDSTEGIAYDDASYTIYNDLWGKSLAYSGSQCTSVTSIKGNVIAWKTSWSWEGNSTDVKSYANVAYKYAPKQLSAISSINTEWKWRYTGSNITADVAYDCFTASTSGAQTNEYEVMIWLAALGGAGPISYSYGPNSAISTPEIGGVQWKLFSGTNGVNKVFSFVATAERTHFKGDLKPFFDYLIKYYGLSSSQYLNALGAGTEPFTGSNARFTTTDYYVTVA